MVLKQETFPLYLSSPSKQTKKMDSKDWFFFHKFKHGSRPERWKLQEQINKLFQPDPMIIAALFDYPIRLSSSISIQFDSLSYTTKRDHGSSIFKEQWVNTQKIHYQGLGETSHTNTTLSSTERNILQ